MVNILSEIMPILLNAAPTIASALGSPVAGIVIKILEKAFDVDTGDISSLIDKIKDSVDGTLQDLDTKHAPMLTALMNFKTPSTIEINFKISWPEK